MANVASNQTIDVKQIENVAVITFRGANSMFEGEKVEAVARELFAFLESGKANKILLDLGNIYFMSSAMLAQLVRMQRQIQAKKGRLRLCSPRPAIQDAFKVSRFDKFFEIYPDAASALRKF